MSYDLLVFDPAAAPRPRAAFLAWYREQTRWTELHGYDNPAVPSAPLRAWFREMIETFPPMNGPLASEDLNNPNVTDYSLGATVIYAAFAWSQADAAYEQVTRLAAKHRVGFFDASATDGDIWLPTPGGFEKSRDGDASQPSSGGVRARFRDWLLRRRLLK